MSRHYIWFKTRVGLASVTEPCEILVWKSTKAAVWYISAHMKTEPEITMKNFWGRSGSISAPFLHLAFFSDGPGVSKAIAECMARIQDSICTKAELCDLSEIGDPQAWGQKWHQIKWNDSTAT